jgi:hypothetical protein
MTGDEAPGRTVPMTTVGAAFVESGDAVKQERGSLPCEKISIRFRRCCMLGRGRAFRRIPEFKMFQDPLDDAGIAGKADNTKAAATLGAS